MSDQEREQLKVAESDISYGDNLFARLAMSKFRSSFSLNSNDRVYVKEKGMDTIRSHARDFVQKRLAPAVIPNDGKQTPMKGHPLTSKRDVSAYLHSAARLIACAHYIMNL
ncbi:MAG: DUF4186 domain-containing protein [Lachnospiraceae bacterium]|nr:DUF4186 domain-containing protein [Lachnospiraceae bacterium]